MDNFTLIVLMTSELLSEIFFIWLIIQCRSLFTGFISTCTAIATCCVIYRYSFYIAEAIIWGIRFSAVIAILAFILGIFPRTRRNSV